MASSINEDLVDNLTGWKALAEIVFNNLPLWTMLNKKFDFLSDSQLDLQSQDWSNVHLKLITADLIENQSMDAAIHTLIDLFGLDSSSRSLVIKLIFEYARKNVLVESIIGDLLKNLGDIQKALKEANSV